MCEIPVTDVGHVLIGQNENVEAATGCTVFIAPEGMRAGMAHDGYARSINPVHTTADGDSIYAASVGEIEADQDLVGMLAAEVVSEAITRAVTSADGAYGYPAASDLQSRAD